MWETASGFVKPVRFIALLSTGLLAGVLCDFWVFIGPALATLPGPAFIETTQAIDKQFYDPIPRVYQLVLVSLTLLLLLMIREWRSLVWALLALAMICAVLATVETLMVNVPINIEVINDWSAQAPPANWAAERDRWDQANTFRAIMFVVAFVLQLIAVLLPSRSPVAARQQAGFGRVQPATER